MPNRNFTNVCPDHGEYFTSTAPDTYGVDCPACEDQPTYSVFVRDWWHYSPSGKLEAGGWSERETLAEGITLAEARELCREYNESHDPGPLSRKAEFESD